MVKLNLGWEGRIRYMAKRPASKPRIPRPKRPKRPEPDFLDMAGMLAGMLGALFGRSVNGLPAINRYQCSRCGVRVTMGVVPRYCPNGCGETMRPFMPTTGAWPPPPKPSVPKMSRVAAARFLSKFSSFTVSGLLEHTNTCARPAYLQAVKYLHPDNKETGSHELFLKLQEAMEVLEG